MYAAEKKMLTIFIREDQLTKPLSWELPHIASYVSSNPLFDIPWSYISGRKKDKNMFAYDMHKALTYQYLNSIQGLCICTVLSPFHL